ncbi:hypothetical protein [Desulfobacula toluolica]|nr:hypothetical protein [Desulfobacula toluolica]
MSDNRFFNRAVWKQKAMAFVVRSHRHLWGKNNEDPQAFLFTHGLKNQFIKDALIGWNKFGQTRSIKNWGIETNLKKDEKLFLASGIVIPFIVKKELKSIFIHPYDESQDNKTTIIPGSVTPTMVLGEKKEKVAVIQNIFDGLFLFQELKDTCCIIIHPDPKFVLDLHLNAMLKNADTVLILSSEKKEFTEKKSLFPDVQDHCFYAYQSQDEAKEHCLKN